MTASRLVAALDRAAAERAARSADEYSVRVFCHLLERTRTITVPRIEKIQPCRWRRRLALAVQLSSIIRIELDSGT
jgi:hypothetical protein